MKLFSKIENSKDITDKGYVDKFYKKPTSGIPKSDLTSAVQTSLGKADAAVPNTRKVNNKVLSSDITLLASDVGALPDTTVIPTKVSDLTNDSGFTTNTGTVTSVSVKMNGASKGTVTSSGTIDLGTVLTDASKFATSAQGTKADNAMPKSGGTFTGEVKFGNTENFQGYYIKRMLGSLGAGTAYNNLDPSYKDGNWHRMWRLRFPSGSNFWGKIKVTLYGGYSSFNASGVMSKSITCNFNTSSIYNNVGCYDGLGVNVEQDFRISEAIWNATANAWEVLIWQKNLSGNNSPTIMLECWTTNNTNYINAFNGIAAQTVELTQSTSYSAQRASSTGGTKTVMWATLPVYENPLGEEIATVAMLEDKQDKITSSNKLSASLVSGLSTVATSGSYNDLSNKPTIPTVNNGTLTIQKNGTKVRTFTANQSTNVTANITVPTKVSELTNDSGYTTNKGTVTSVSVKMNGASKGTVTSSGTIDLGTVVTDVSGKLDKTTYEVNKTIEFGSSGVLYIGKFKVYDTNVTCEVTSTTNVTYSGKLVIATQNNVIMQMTVYGDAANTVAPNFFIKPSTTSDPYIEIYFKPASWSKNVVHIYGSAISAEPTNVCTSVSAVPSTATLKPTNALNSKANLNGGNTFTGPQLINKATLHISGDSSFDNQYFLDIYDSAGAGDDLFSVYKTGTDAARVMIGNGVAEVELNVRESAGTAGQVLTSQGAGKTPTWTTPPQFTLSGTTLTITV